MPLATVVIPFFNQHAYLVEALESLKRQTFSDFELVIVDDCSDRPVGREAIDRTLFPVKVLRNHERRGPGPSRNAGVGAAAGRWIAFLDADDRWAPERLGASISALESTGARWSYTDGYYFKGESTSRRLHSRLVGFKHGLPDRDEVLPGLAAGRSFVLMSSVTVEKAFFETLGGFDESLPVAEDWDLFVRMAGSAPPVLVDRPLTHYRISADGYHYKNIDRYMSLHENRIRRVHDDPRWKGRLSGSVASAMATVARNASIQHLNAGRRDRARHLLFSRKFPVPNNDPVTLMLKLSCFLPTAAYRLARRLYSGI